MRYISYPRGWSTAIFPDLFQLAFDICVFPKQNDVVMTSIPCTPISRKLMLYGHDHAGS